MEEPLNYTLVLPPGLVHTVGALIGLFVASALIYITLPKTDKAEPPLARLRERLGLTAVHPIVVMALLFFYAALALTLLFGVFGLILRVLVAGTPDTYLTYVLRIAGLTTVLGAVIALPLTVIRLRLNHTQTDTARQSLFNDKINEATKGLFARRQVSGENGDRWEDDVVQRCAAIDRLEGLAQENPDEVRRIARLLSVYVRELSKEIPPQEPPDDMRPAALRGWVDALPAPRSDMEKAGQTLGRLQTIPEANLARGDIDLRGANLQKADLNGLNFNNALLQDACFQGAQLSHTWFHEADLESADLLGANLVFAQLQGAILTGASLQSASLYSANLQGAKLFQAFLQCADLCFAQVEGSSLSDALLSGASVRGVNLTDLPYIETLLAYTFGDASVTLPQGARPGEPGWPAHWATTELNEPGFKIAWFTWQKNLHDLWQDD